MIYRVFIDFNKLESAAQSIVDLPAREKELKLIQEYIDKDIYVQASSMTEAISKVGKLLGTEPYSIEETNFVVI